jgi:hypothetical protein
VGLYVLDGSPEGVVVVQPHYVVVVVGGVVAVVVVPVFVVVTMYIAGLSGLPQRLTKSFPRLVWLLWFRWLLLVGLCRLSCRLL